MCSKSVNCKKHSNDTKTNLIKILNGTQSV